MSSLQALRDPIIQSKYTAEKIFFKTILQTTLKLYQLNVKIYLIIVLNGEGYMQIKQDMFDIIDIMDHFVYVFKHISCFYISAILYLHLLTFLFTLCILQTSAPKFLQKGTEVKHKMLCYLPIVDSGLHYCCQSLHWVFINGILSMHLLRKPIPHAAMMDRIQQDYCCLSYFL